jgi:hypothetical protein
LAAAFFLAGDFFLALTLVFLAAAFFLALTLVLAPAFFLLVFLEATAFLVFDTAFFLEIFFFAGIP